MREAVYRDDVPEDVEFIDLQCTRVRYALPKIVRLIWQRRPDVVFSTLGHLNLALAMLRPLLPNGVRYIGREVCVVSETLSEYTHPRLWRLGVPALLPAFRCYGMPVSAYAGRPDQPFRLSLRVRPRLSTTPWISNASVASPPRSLRQTMSLRRRIPMPRRTWSPPGACRTRKASIC